MLAMSRTYGAIVKHWKISGLNGFAGGGIPQMDLNGLEIAKPLVFVKIR